MKNLKKVITQRICGKLIDIADNKVRDHCHIKKKKKMMMVLIIEELHIGLVISTLKKFL